MALAELSASEPPRRARGRDSGWRVASDDVLVRAIRRGSDGAFTALFDRYYAPLERYCQTLLRHNEDAQDAAQNALVAALRALNGGASRPLAVRAWLYRIARNEALALARLRSQTLPFEEGVVLIAAPEDAGPRADFAQLLDDLRRLPERQRTALVLRELEGLSYAEVACALAMSQDGARAAVFEARSALGASRSGRATSCTDIQRRLSDGDGRTIRALPVRAHLSDCLACSSFSEQLRQRRRALRILFPLPGVVGGTGWLFGVGAGGGAVAKCVTGCASAALIGGSLIVAMPREHPRPPAQRAERLANPPADEDRARRAAPNRPSASGATRHATTAKEGTRPPRPRVQAPATLSGSQADEVASVHAPAPTIEATPAPPAAPAAKPDTTPQGAGGQSGAQEARDRAKRRFADAQQARREHVIAAQTQYQADQQRRSEARLQAIEAAQAMADETIDSAEAIAEQMRQRMSGDTP